jgi:hypothetical protein
VVDNSVVNIHLPSKDEHGKYRIRGKDEFGAVARLGSDVSGRGGPTMAERRRISRPWSAASSVSNQRNLLSLVSRASRYARLLRVTVLLRPRPPALA